MIPKPIINYLAKRKGAFPNQYDGSSKYLTKNCLVCDMYATLDDEKLCFWALSWSKLVSREAGPRKCEYFGKPSPREEMVKVLVTHRSDLERFLRITYEDLPEKLKRRITLEDFSSDDEQL